MKKWKVSFGKTRSYYELENSTHANTRYKYFNTKKQAEKYLNRLHKFNFQDPYFYEFKFIAWTSLTQNRNFNK